jgi:hypothetical protein
VPPREVPDAVSVGVQTTGRRRASTDRKRTVPAMTAGEASSLFPKGGEAFTTWCSQEKGLGLTERRTEDEWASLLAEFAERPIHGHRMAGQE